MSKHLVSANGRGVITLPKSLRGTSTLYEARLKDGGVIELIPQRTVPASQAWFWTERWQAMEHEADADKVAGRVQHFDDAEAFLETFNAD